MNFLIQSLTFSHSSTAFGLVGGNSSDSTKDLLLQLIHSFLRVCHKFRFHCVQQKNKLIKYIYICINECNIFKNMNDAALRLSPFLHSVRVTSQVFFILSSDPAVKYSGCRQKSERTAICRGHKPDMSPITSLVVSCEAC